MASDAQQSANVQRPVCRFCAKYDVFPLLSHINGKMSAVNDPSSNHAVDTFCGV